MDKKNKERDEPMKELNEQELTEIQGGGISVGTCLLIVAGVTFVVGFIDGIVRPLKCN